MSKRYNRQSYLLMALLIINIAIRFAAAVAQ